MNTLQKRFVKDAYHLDNEDPILVKLNDEFSQVIQNFALHTELRGVFVVDDDNRFLGVITRTDQLEWAQAKLGAILLKPLTDMDKTIRLITLIGSSSVGDILRQETKTAAVLENDTLAEALRKMIATDLIILPVIDESHRIIGSLTLSELLNLTLLDS
jgi:CBS domain-containing protein